VSKCSFNFDFPISADELVRRIDTGIRGAGGEFSGDSESGFYSVPTPVGSIEGSYAVSGQTIQIDVLEKPILLPCSLIEMKLSQIVQSAKGG
jgi:hypothetical protein